MFGCWWDVLQRYVDEVVDVADVDAVDVLQYSWKVVLSEYIHTVYCVCSTL